MSFGSTSKASSIVELNCIFGLNACVCVSVCMPSGVYSSVRHVVLPLKCHGLSSLIVYLV